MEEEWIPASPPPSSPPCSLCSTPYSSAGLSSSLGEDKVKRQCSVIFLVRKLFKIPLPECQELLRNYGDPEEWMDLCPTCTSILNEALDLNDEINRMRRRIEELGEQLALPLHIKLEEGEEEVIPNMSSAARYIRRIVFNRGVLQRQCQPSTGIGNIEDEDTDDNGVIIAPTNIGPSIKKTDSDSGFTEVEAPMDLIGFIRNLNSGLDHFLPLSPFHNFTAEGEDEDSESESDNSRDEDYVFPEVTTKIESESEAEEEERASSSSVSVPLRKKQKGTQKKRLARRKEGTRRKPAALAAGPKGSRLFECDEGGCSEKFKTREECVLHKKRHHAVGFPCEKCGRRMKSFTTLENHVRKKHYHENETKTILTCPGCGGWWHGDISEFQKHLRKPDCKPECKEKTVPCSQCLWRFENQTTLDLHMKIKHLTTYAPFVCPHPECGITFRSKKAPYYAHVKSHTEDISQICHLCGNRYASLYRLKNHVAETHGNADYKCDQCGQAFKRKTHLRRHQKLHTDVFPYLCTLCGKRFRMTNQLTVHMWSHDPDRKDKYSTYKPKPKGYKPMREKRKRFRPTGRPPEEEIQERQISINTSTENAISMDPRPGIPGFLLPIPMAAPAQSHDARMMGFF